MSLTYLENEELETELVGDSVYFGMSEIEVDGIKSKKRIDTDSVSKPMFSLKYEFDIFGRPSDTGLAFRWLPELQISEKHWVSCGRVIPKNSRCDKCGKVN